MEYLCIGQRAARRSVITGLQLNNYYYWDIDDVTTRNDEFQSNDRNSNV